MKTAGPWIGAGIGAAYAWWAVCTSWGVYPVNREAAVWCLVLAGAAVVLVGLGSLVGLRLRRMAPPLVRSLHEREALRAARRVVRAEDGMRRVMGRRYGRLLGSLAVMLLAVSASAQEAIVLDGSGMEGIPVAMYAPTICVETNAWAISMNFTFGPVEINTTNGAVRIRDGTTMDEASREFWRAVMRSFPATFTNRQEKAQ